MGPGRCSEGVRPVGAAQGPSGAALHRQVPPDLTPRNRVTRWGWDPLKVRVSDFEFPLLQQTALERRRNGTRGRAHGGCAHRPLGPSRPWCQRGANSHHGSELDLARPFTNQPRPSTIPSTSTPDPTPPNDTKKRQDAFGSRRSSVQIRPPREVLAERTLRLVCQ